MADVYISNNATSNGAFSGTSTVTFTATGQPATANAGAISGYLAAGENVVVTSTSAVGAHSSITVQAPINGGSGAVSLTLDTDDIVEVEAAVALPGVGSSLVLHGASGVVEPGGGSISAGSLTASSQGGVNLGDVGNFIATLSGLTGGGDSIVRDESALTVSGAVNVGAHALYLSVGGDLIQTAGAPLTAGAATYISTHDITLLQQSQVSSLSLSAASGSVTLGGPTAVSSLLSVSAAHASTASGAISGAGALRVSGGGTLTLSATNTYSGGTTVTGGGVLVANHANANGIDALGSGAVTLDGGELRDGTGNGIGNAVVVGAGGGVLSGSGFTLNGAITGGGALTTNTSVNLVGDNSGFTGALNVASGYLEALSSHALSAGSAVTVAAGATLTLALSETAGSLSGAGTVTTLPIIGTTTLTTGGSGASTTFSGVIQDGFGFGTLLALSKAGAGVFTLSGANTYTGGTIISAGVLRIGDGGTTGSIMGDVTDNAVLEFTRSDARTFTGAISGSGAVVVDGGGTQTLTLTGADTYTGGTTVSVGVLRIGNGGTTGSITGNVTDDATLEFSRSDAATFAGAISGSGKVVVDSGGVLTLSATNGYGGGTAVTGGSTLIAGHDSGTTFDSLGSGTITLNSGTLRLFGSPGNAATLLNNLVAVGPGGGALAAGGQGAFVNGGLTGAGALTLTGGPNVVLNRDDSAFTGSVTVAQGGTVLAATNALTATNAVTVASGAYLDLGGNTIALGSLSGAGNVTNQFGPANTSAALTAGALGTSTTFSGALSDGTVSSPSSLAKVGAGALTITGANTYTGTTAVNGGVLAVDGSLTSAVTVANGATLRGVGADTAGVTVQAGGTFAPGEGTGTFTAASLAQGGVFAETITAAASGRLVTTGAAGVTLMAGASLSLTYTGGAEAYGTVYTLAQATGGGVVTGTFSNSTVTSGGHTFQVGYTATAITLTDVTNTAPSVAGTHASATSDRASDSLFSGVTVSDPDTPAQAETATISFAAGAGVLTGAGAAATAGGTTTYTLQAASAQALTTALQGVGFQPTAAPAGPSTSTTFSLSVSDGAAASATDMATVVTVTHGTNTAPALSGAPASVTEPPAAPVTLAPALAITDLDAGAMVRSAQVTIASGFTAADVLTVTAAPGITAAYDAAAGQLTLTGTASDAAYQQTLETVAFSHPGAVAAGARTVTFSVVDDQGAASNTASETVNVSAYSPYTGPTTPAQTPSQAAGLATEVANLIRAAAGDPALGDPSSPMSAQAQAEVQIAARLDAGQLTPADAQAQLFHLVDGTTSVAEIAYAFFTGRTPTAAGLDYLVHSTANPTDLNDPYYARFTTENRYINFAANLATGSGAGAASFQAAYGGLSLADATAKAYAAIFGFAPAAGKVDAILNAQVPNGLGGTETRAQYLADITGGSAAAQKAAAIGFLLADSVKEGFGTYQQADLHFLADLAHGTAAFNVDLLAAYGQAPSLVGQPVVDPTLGS